jgi:hypothetical protein
MQVVIFVQQVVDDGIALRVANPVVRSEARDFDHTDVIPRKLIDQQQIGAVDDERAMVTGFSSPPSSFQSPCKARAAAESALWQEGSVVLRLGDGGEG